MKTLFYDTETTGLPDFHKPAEDPSQPHIVQIGAIMCDDNRRVVAEINLLVKPEGWTIPAEATAVHGITQEMAEKCGIGLTTVMGIFIDLAYKADLLVAHNDSFDAKMVRRELHHIDMPSLAEGFRNRPSFCTMKATTEICKLPGKYGYKWPRMTEAYAHFFGKEFDGAHDAMADVRACRDVYYALHPIPTQPEVTTP